MTCLHELLPQHRQHAAQQQCAAAFMVLIVQFMHLIMLSGEAQCKAHCCVRCAVEVTMQSLLHLLLFRRVWQGNLLCHAVELLPRRSIAILALALGQYHAAGTRICFTVLEYLPA
jgi:hypothetical protein